MKIGAGGLQSQIIEDAVKIRDVDPVRNKPGHDDALAANLIAGQKKAKEQVTKRPVDKTMQNSKVYNQKVSRREEQQNQKHGENQEQQKQRKAKKVDLYI
ncbi:hypothetical protein SAMN05660649_00180 [Desulfotomaculum arcticum]|uniref:Uncharacterized protein n=1 Tax=Desulfotruncus arcticus DSM 17038 TaxID=1121424 RepID=A0A1I2N127_9FIRM|nr:hypothetical protein [Desulfotruncus arcticus]SFF95397.1 hypothetical protein SAMN05660649_00180 [Desulfotomaculum arcticum] [Desulfotruncus arcticus DSM 17038]